MIRAQSSPSQLVIRDADLLQKVKDTLAAVSTPIKLEDRRKYAPLTPAGHDRPKLLASVNGLISVEPTFRKTLSQGSNIDLFGNAEKMASAAQGYALVEVAYELSSDITSRSMEAPIMDSFHPVFNFFSNF